MMNGDFSVCLKSEMFCDEYFNWPVQVDDKAPRLHFFFLIFLGRSSFRGNPWSLNDHTWIYVMLSLKGLDQTLCIWNVKSEFGSKKMQQACTFGC